MLMIIPNYKNPYKDCPGEFHDLLLYQCLHLRRIAFAKLAVTGSIKVNDIPLMVEALS